MIAIRTLLPIFAMLFFGTAAQSQNKRPVVKIETSEGDILVELYNETPLHRDNFLKLAGQGFYDSTLFHRVIKDFMVQGGDPESKGAGKDKTLGEGGPGYTIPAEFHKDLYHQRGALAAARKGDNVNPERASSGSQFYIVQGRTFNDSMLNNFEERINAANMQEIASAFIQRPENAAYLQRIREAQQNQDREALKQLDAELMPMIEAEARKNRFQFTPGQREVYKTKGGTPHLDMQYTVFGQVIDGMDVVDKIASKPTLRDRPVEDVWMKISVVK